MREKLFFKNSKGYKLCGILSNPTSSIVKPIIILCHGFGSDRNSNTCIGLEKSLNKYEISTFRFDFYGVGESEGNHEDITISEAVDDVLNCINFLERLGYKKIGLFGSSFGGSASIIAASKTPGLYILSLKSPVSHYMDKLLFQMTTNNIDSWKKEGYTYYATADGRKHKLNYSFFEDAKKYNGYGAAKKITTPTIIIHGDKDETVPIGQSKKIASIIKNCKLEIIHGADHKYSDPKDFKKMLNLISRFIIDNS